MIKFNKILPVAVLGFWVATSSSVAHAGGLYVYVDDAGIPHYALQKLDERYELFVHDGPVLSDDVKIVAKNPDGFGMDVKIPDMSKYDKGTSKGMALTASGIRVPEPSKSVLNRLLRNQSLARYEGIISKHARTHGVDVNLVKAVMAAESGFNPNAISPKNALGLMQVIPPTAARYGVTANQLMSPERNIYAGVRYLADLSRMFRGRPELIVAAYNAGEGAVYKYNRNIPPYKETQNYVRTVLQFYKVYQPSGVGSSTLLASDSGTGMVQHVNSRRSSQRVSIKVGGKLNKAKLPTVMEN